MQVTATHSLHTILFRGKASQYTTSLPLSMGGITILFPRLDLAVDS
jgi:hypothetical protein